MVLDSEQQKTDLFNLIKAVQLQGTYEQIGELHARVTALLTAIKDARVEENKVVPMNEQGATSYGKVKSK